jgi:hypothetical protein
MTQDEIIEMYLEVSNKLCNGTEWCWAGVGEPLQLFAKLVAQHERKACVKIVENEAWQYTSPVWAVEIVNDIRERGQA